MPALAVSSQKPDRVSRALRSSTRDQPSERHWAGAAQGASSLDTARGYLNSMRISRQIP